MCFKILRTNEDGSVRMVYSGVATSGKCKNMTDTNPSIGDSKYNYGSTETVDYVTMGSNEVFDDSISHSPIIDLLNRWYVNNIITGSRDSGGNVSNTAIYCNNQDVFLNATGFKYFAAKILTFSNDGEFFKKFVNCI
jgi:hypothetical protein